MEEPKVTEWNAAKASLQRLHGLLMDCNDFSRKAECGLEPIIHAKLWKSTLKSVFYEISAKLSKEERKKIVKYFKYYNELGPLVRYEKKALHAYSSSLENVQVLTKNFNKYMRITSKIEQLLRKFADNHGMLVPDKDDDEGL